MGLLNGAPLDYKVSEALYYTTQTFSKLCVQTGGVLTSPVRHALDTIFALNRPAEGAPLLNRRVLQVVAGSIQCILFAELALVGAGFYVTGQILKGDKE